MAQRYYQKSYDTDTVPGTNGAVAIWIIWDASGSENSIAIGNIYGWQGFRVPMRVSPTVTIWGFAGTKNTVSNANGTDLAANSGAPSQIGPKGFVPFNNTGGTLTTTGASVVYQYEANAEM